MYEAAAAASRPLNDDAGSGGVGSFAEAAKSLLTSALAPKVDNEKRCRLPPQILFQSPLGTNSNVWRYISLDRE